MIILYENTITTAESANKIKITGRAIFKAGTTAKTPDIINVREAIAPAIKKVY
ncbi:hypothetical protein [Wolbachia endosymbiont of Trichogramma pretiosum]|uniref:hypothetical protein n=1 Tax=Wolbachia endosymbiont of Trichogramma pretiosum TaxID=125593 RepID=UPI001FDEC753|nr:hypothetical protein [Wolbachia endosymbiont of Trichogramma pretiosum]OCA06152.1 hypothetical protein wTpre_475 [Wolbachia endosymbiont of Trichogramma pretiosum]